MKKLLLGFTFLVLGTLAVNAQNDTVCVGATGVSYWVNGKAGSTFNWTINGGTKASGGNTDSITIDFSSTAGTDTITVVETDSNGCVGAPVQLAIVRMPLPDATISSSISMCYQDSATLTVSLTGSAPWDLTYNDGSGNQTVQVTTSPYSIPTGSLSATKTYTLVTVEDRLSCLTTLSGGSTSTTVTVFPQVVTPSIQHN